MLARCIIPCLDMVAHLAEALEAGAHGVLAASVFHLDGHSLPQARAYLRDRGYPVRP